MTRGSQAGAVTALLLAAVAFGCGGNAEPVTSDSPAVSTASDQAEITVPDVTGQDGADAVSAVEGEGLTTTLNGVADDADFDPNRDPQGCSVEDQDPSGGTDAAEGDEVTLTVDCRQTDWDNQEGGAWDEFGSAYENGFDDGCAASFAETSNGSLYQSDTEYTASDCPPAPDAADSVGLPSDFPDDPQSEGYDVGFEDGCDSLFDDVALSPTLYNGTDSYTAEDCKAQSGGGGAPPARGGGSEPPKSAPAGPDATLEDYGPNVGADTWGGYSKEKQRAVADLFVRNNPVDCRGVDPAQLRKSVNAGYGIDFPFAAPVKKLLLNYCKVLRGQGE